MNLFSCCLILCFLSFSKAYGNNKNYLRDYPSGYCVLGNTPVCGTNGHEYFLLENECEFNNFNSKQLEKGQLVLFKTSIDFCHPPPAASLVYSQPKYDNYCPQYCNKILKPLCASYRNEQRNFTNECVLKKHICDTKENWQVILNDTCVSASCALDGQEICASLNGYTQSFPNLLSLYGEIQTRGKEWQILNVGPCPCPEDYRPICAQLNCTAKTFTNECFLEREIKNGSHWSILFYGECPQIPSSTANPNPANADSDVDEGVESGDGPLDVDDAIAKALGEEPKPRKNKPVYIVKNNQISPYIPPIYQTKPPAKSKDQISPYISPIYQAKPPAKSKDYYHPYNMPKTQQKPYETPTKKPYEKYATYSKDPEPPKSLYDEPDADIISKTMYNYAANVNPPDYQSFFKPLNAPPLAMSAVSYASSGYHNKDLYADSSVNDLTYQNYYDANYSPVSIATYSDMSISNYGDINYNDEELYDSLYESFT